MASPSGTVLFSTVPSRLLLDGVRDLVDVDALLSETERQRRAALVHVGDQEDFVAARLLTRWLLVRLTRPRDRTVGALDEWSLGSLSGFRIGQRCGRCAGPHGRPFVTVTGVRVSWAHAGGHVAAAVGCSDVGVDVEPLDGRPGRGPATHNRPDGRHRSLLSWVRGEALVKCGHGQLSDAATWTLDSPLAPLGRRYWIPAGRGPRPRRPLTLGRVPSAVVTDLAVTGANAVVCSVAAAQQARFELPRWC